MPESTLSVLVAERSPGCADALSLLLDCLGHSVMTNPEPATFDGDALPRLDLAFVDLDCAEGVRFAWRLLRRAGPRPVVVGTTARPASLGDVPDGIDYVLRKPYPLPDLLRLLDAASAGPDGPVFVPAG